MSKELANEAMAALGFNNPQVVYATLEAETNFSNKLGDSGRAFGYGQVWLRWHFPKLEKVAKMLNVTLPGPWPKTEQEEQKFKPLILGNDRLSMYLAVETIKSFWQGSGGDWVQFTKMYVGPAIPDSDLNRRRKIYEKYAGNVPAPSGPSIRIGGSSVAVPIPPDSSQVFIGLTIAAAGLAVIAAAAGVAIPIFTVGKE